GMALNIGSGQPITICDVAAELAKALGTQLAPQISGKYRAGDIRHCFADISAAGKVLGYRPRVRFGEGIQELVQWLGSQKAVDRSSEAVERLALYGLAA
ncbi:MAG TPA: nucleoside-diphosphate-sugar epimerase, partial [Terriglobales bacterium]|nr:nucleoside-diphosphate-sugar epimerase [Terriglobales bacterium]